MRRILAILLLLALLCGCTGQGIPAGENQLTFYYRRADGTNDESFASETGALTEKRVTLGGDVSVEEVLEAYLQPPEDEGLVSLFPDGTICTGTKLQKGVLTLEMNEMYASLTGYARTLAAAGLTMTLTQLDSVDAVQIRTPSGALLGRASMRWTRDSFLLQDTSWLYPEQTASCKLKSAQFPMKARRICWKIHYRRSLAGRRATSCNRRYLPEQSFWTCV